MAPGRARRAHLRGPAGRDAGQLTGAGSPAAGRPGRPAPLVLFDLDGVLADSRFAITSCMNHALAALGREPVPPESLYPLIGPSLSFGFSSLLGVDPDDPRVAECIAAYRSVYAEVSLRATPTYPGVPEALAAIARGARGVRGVGGAAPGARCSGGAAPGARSAGGASPGARPRLAVATSKPRAFAEPLIAALGFADVFEAIFAPEMDLHVESKTTTVGRALEVLRARTGTMVGDRHVDMEAARAHGLRAVGVTWGFGTAEELLAAGADVLVSSPADLPAAIYAA